jgi:C4-type Zn-finger protein
MTAIITKFLEKIKNTKKCPKCSKIAWKYTFSPFIWHGKEGVVETRICGNCGFKPPRSRFLKGKEIKEKNKAHNI